MSGNTHTHTEQAQSDLSDHSSQQPEATGRNQLTMLRSWFNWGTV